MREIFFRGKRVDNGKWVEGNYSIDVSGRVDILPIDNLVFFEVIPETVGQFTGLTDKNGKKIFEGDILESDSERFVVEWDDEFLGFYLTDVNPRYQGYAMFADVADDGYIIGNIHDNPELLNKGEQLCFF